MSFIQSEIDKNVAVLLLNRPDKFNAFNKEMALELQNKLKEMAENKEVRAILLSALGKAFCAGQDLAEAIEDNGIELPDIVEKHYNPIIQLIKNIEKPIICAVNGVAAGAGANIALTCDIVLADEKASFIQAFSKIGLIPDSGGTFILPRLIGWQKAAALMMTGEKINATEAEKMGMIYKVYPSDTFVTASRDFAIEIAKMPTKALALTKKLLNVSIANTLEQQLRAEKELQTEAGNSYDYQEGVNAFLEKRNPEFKGE